MQITLNVMKQLDPEKDYYFYEIAIKICARDEDGMRTMHPPLNWVKSAGNGLGFELSRLQILKQYDETLNLLDSTDQVNEAVVLAMKASAYGFLGKTSEAIAQLNKLKKLSTSTDVSTALMALAYMACGDEITAYANFEKAIREKDVWMHFISYTAEFYKRRNDPRLQELMKRIWIN